LQEGRGGYGELGQYPAIGSLIVKHDWIAIVVGLAATAKTGPQRVAGGRPGNQSARGFVEYGKRFVHPLHILSSAHSAVGIGRCSIRGKAQRGVPQAIKT